MVPVTGKYPLRSNLYSKPVVELCIFQSNEGYVNETVTDDPCGCLRVLLTQVILIRNLFSFKSLKVIADTCHLKDLVLPYFINLSSDNTA